MACHLAASVRRWTAWMFLWGCSCSAGAFPVTMIFTSHVQEAPQGPGAVLTGPIRLTYTFESGLLPGSGPLPTTFGLASYGPITSTLEFLNVTVPMEAAGSGISISALDSVYFVEASAHNVGWIGTTFGAIRFQFVLFDTDFRVLRDVSLPLDTAFVADIDRAEVHLTADNRHATGVGNLSTFTLVPESSTGAMAALGLLVLAALTRKARARKRRHAPTLYRCAFDARSPNSLARKDAR